MFSALPDNFDVRYLKLPDRFDMDVATELVLRNSDRSRPVVVVGHSLGGYVALESVRRYGDLVDGVVATGVGGNSGKVATLKLLILSALSLPFQRFGIDPLVDVVGVQDKISDDDILDEAIEQENFDYRAMFSGVLFLLRYDKENRLDYDGPLTILNGRNDPAGKGASTGQRQHYRLRLVDGGHLGLQSAW